jgi:hypothetical protein
MKQREAILSQVASRAGGFPKRMSVNMDAVQNFIAFVVPLSFGANYGHLVSGVV